MKIELIRFLVPLPETLYKVQVHIAFDDILKTTVTISNAPKLPFILKKHGCEAKDRQFPLSNLYL